MHVQENLAKETTQLLPFLKSESELGLAVRTSNASG